MEASKLSNFHFIFLTFSLEAFVENNRAKLESWFCPAVATWPSQPGSPAPVRGVPGGGGLQLSVRTSQPRRPALETQTDWHGRPGLCPAPHLSCRSRLPVRSQGGGQQADVTAAFLALEMNKGSYSEIDRMWVHSPIFSRGLFICVIYYCFSHWL